MKINESCIDYNAVRIIEGLVESRYELIDKDGRIERGFILMTLGEISGVLDMAKAMKEVLNT